MSLIVAPGRRRARASRARRGSRNQLGAGILLAGPFVLLFLVCFVAPVIYSMVASLYVEKASGLGFGGTTRQFAGPANYTEALTDPVFWRGLGHVMLFGIVQVPFMLLAALALALLLDSAAARGTGVFRTTYFLPYAIPGIIAALLWSYLYLPELSPYVQAMRVLGIDINLLGPGAVMWSMANITTWCFTGYNTFIIYASLKAIPSDLHEAARIDGAGEWRIALYVKIPAVRNAIVLTGVQSIIGTLQLFTEPTVLLNISSAVDSNFTPTMYAMRTAFRGNDAGFASAVSILVAVFAAVLSIIYYRLTTRRDNT